MKPLRWWFLVISIFVAHNCIAQQTEEQPTSAWGPGRLDAAASATTLQRYQNKTVTVCGGNAGSIRQGSNIFLTFTNDTGETKAPGRADFKALLNIPNTPDYLKVCVTGLLEWVDGAPQITVSEPGQLAEWRIIEKRQSRCPAGQTLAANGRCQSSR